MMNDQFSVELRQHLLATADERPGDGRLAAIVEGVAVTGQRPALVSRLPWSRAHLNPFQSRAMRYGFLAAALIISLIGLALLAAGGFASRTAFSGKWSSTDPADGSAQTLIIGGGTRPTVQFQDQHATGAACVNDAVKVFEANGTGSISNDHLNVSFPDGGGCGSTKVEVAMHLVHEAATDSLRDQDGVRWVRVVGPEPVSTPSPTPNETTRSPSPAPTPHAGESSFTSTIHGFSMGVPEGWKTRPATEPWTGGPLDFDSPAADIIFDPRSEEGTYLLVASQPFVDLSEDAWKTSVMQWTCGNGSGEFWSWHVDGVSSSQRGPCNSGSIIATDTRGYLIRLVAATDSVWRADHWDQLKPMLETVDLRPEDAVDAAGAGAPVPACSDIADGATYRNRFGSPKLMATVPAGAQSPWLGSRDEFMVGNTCPFGEPVRITASIVDNVILDACSPEAGLEVRITSPAEAVDAIIGQQGHQVSQPTDVTIADHAATRLEISGKGSPCTDGIAVWSGNEFAEDRDEIAYLVDMDGKTLGIAVAYVRDQTTPHALAEAEAIVASIQVR